MDYNTEYIGIPYRILRRPGGELILDAVPGGTELELQVKAGSWAGYTHSNIIPTSSVLEFIVQKQ